MAGAQDEIETLEIFETRTRAIQFGSNAVTRLEPGQQFTNPVNIAEFLDQSPGVVKSGQNGLFQVFSIRGVSGQRLQTRFNGIPISTERRAGTAAAFIDPWFLQQVSVVRGPGSTLYGSGAVGGTVLTEARDFSGLEASLGYELHGTQRAQAVAYGAENWSIGLSRRSAANGETPEGENLHTGFQQTSLMLQRQWRSDSLQVDALALLGRGADIGRSNSLYPETRITDIADSDNNLLQLRISSEAGWRAEIYSHDYKTRSESISVGDSFSVVNNSSADRGVHLYSSWRRSNWSGNFGVEIDIRNNVEAIETIVDLESLSRVDQVNLNAEQRSYGVYATLTLDMLNHSVELGLRQNRIEQSAIGQDNTGDNDLTGYLGWQWFLSSAWSLSSEIAAAYRVPNLTERYFNGTTGRGTSNGNPDLEDETAPGVDIGLHWRRGRNNWSAHWFYQSFEDYIERIAINESTYSFDNRQKGFIKGLEIEGNYSWSSQWSLSYGMHWLDGEGDNNVAIADVPATVINLGLNYTIDAWHAGARWLHRFDKNDVAATELPLDRADLLDLFVNYSLSEQSRLTLYTRNTLDDSYRITADEISTLGNQRIIGLRFAYQFNPQ